MSEMINKMRKTLIPFLAGVVLACQVVSPVRAAAAAKKILVVTTTTGFRHSGSITSSQKVLPQLAEQSNGAFTFEFVNQPKGKPGGPHKPKDLPPNASAEQQASYKAALEQFAKAQAAYEDAEAKWNETLKQALMKLSPDSLKNYDAVMFANTTGDLPIPDKEGFLNWIKAGGAFIAVHSASDTFHGWPGYIEMLGGEFLTHGAQVSVECINVNPGHPANQKLGRSWVISQEEIYRFKNYDGTKVHDLLFLDKHPNDKTPGHYPVSWSKNYGKGHVFYTSLGHREDIWDADPAMKDRKNPVEVSLAYQAHLVGGIKWALGLADSK